MKLLDFFRNHNELVELLIEGSNPYATQALPQTDIDVLRRTVGRDERIRAYAQGRSVGQGRSVWVVTDEALLVLQTLGTPTVRRIDLGDVQAASLQKGRYGQTLTLTAIGQRTSIYGLARTPAVMLQRALQPDASEQIFLPESEVKAQLQDLLDLQLRVQPLMLRSEAEAQQLFAQVAARARADGMLRDSEIPA